MITETMTNQEIFRELEKIYPELLDKVGYYSDKYIQKASVWKKIQESFDTDTVKFCFKFDYKFKDNTFVLMSFFKKAFGMPLTFAPLKLWKKDGYHYYLMVDKPGESDDLSVLRDSSRILIEGNLDNYSWRELEEFQKEALKCPHNVVEFCPHFINRFIERLGNEKINLFKNILETDIIGVIFYGLFQSQASVKRHTVGQILEEFVKIDPKDDSISKYARDFNKYFEKEESIYRKRRSTIVKFYDGAAILNWNDCGVVFTTFVDEDSLKKSQNEYINESLRFNYILLNAFAGKNLEQ